jgi:hypothetical protein
MFNHVVNKKVTPGSHILIDLLVVFRVGNVGVTLEAEAC